MIDILLGRSLFWHLSEAYKSISWDPTYIFVSNSVCVDRIPDLLCAELRQPLISLGLFLDSSSTRMARVLFFLAALVGAAAAANETIFQVVATKDPGEFHGSLFETGEEILIYSQQYEDDSSSYVIQACFISPTHHLTLNGWRAKTQDEMEAKFSGCYCELPPKKDMTVCAEFEVEGAISSPNMQISNILNQKLISHASKTTMSPYTMYPVTATDSLTALPTFAGSMQPTSNAARESTKATSRASTPATTSATSVASAASASSSVASAAASTQSWTAAGFMLAAMVGSALAF